MSTSTQLSTTSAAGKRLALVIGVDAAPHALLPPLQHAVTDAEQIADVLQRYCHFELSDPPLLGELATSDAVKKAVRKLARNRVDEDFLLLYFSGHGQPMPIEAGRQDIYLVTHDFAEIDVGEDEDAHFSMRWLQEKFYLTTLAGRVLVILDCCYAGDFGRIAQDPYLEELRQRVNYYFGAPGNESGARSGGLRLALAATGHHRKSVEVEGHGLMTGHLLPALRGERTQAFDDEGQVSLELLYSYLKKVMPPTSQPSVSGDFAGRSCVLANYPERAAELRKRRSHLVVSDHPRNYLPFPRNLLFQPRPGEFEDLEEQLFGLQTQQGPVRLGLVGVIGMTEPTRYATRYHQAGSEAESGIRGRRDYDVAY